MLDKEGKHSNDDSKKDNHDLQQQIESELKKKD